MSHEIVKSLTIRDGKVYRKSESNNVRPHYFIEVEDTYFTAMLNNEGERALNIEILRLYEYGSFQEGNPNKWSKAIDKLKQTPEYQKINWRLCTYKDNCPIWQARRDEQTYNSILEIALKFLPATKTAKNNLQLF